MKETTLTKEERDALKARLLARTRADMEREWENPKFREEYEAWKKEYHATVAMYSARRKAGITQAELARRMRSTRMNVRRIENGQNVTLSTLARYLHGCGFDYRLRIFPLARSGRKVAAMAMA